jgi:hypothetical protein
MMTLFLAEHIYQDRDFFQGKSMIRLESFSWCGAISGQTYSHFDTTQSLQIIAAPNKLTYQELFLQL